MDATDGISPGEQIQPQIDGHGPWKDVMNAATEGFLRLYFRKKAEQCNSPGGVHRSGRPDLKMVWPVVTSINLEESKDKRNTTALHAAHLRNDMYYLLMTSSGLHGRGKYIVAPDYVKEFVRAVVPSDKPDGSGLVPAEYIAAYNEMADQSHTTESYNEMITESEVFEKPAYSTESVCQPTPE